MGQVNNSPLKDGMRRRKGKTGGESYPPVSLVKRTAHCTRRWQIACVHINERFKPPAIWTHWLRILHITSVIPWFLFHLVASQSLISPFLLSFSFFSLKSKKTSKKKEVADDL